MGLLAKSVTGEIFLGMPAAGAWCYRYNSHGHEIRAGLRSRPLNRVLPLTILASSRHSQLRVNGVMTALASVASGVERRNAGSALKFSLLASGCADVYPRTSPCYE